MTPSLPRSIVSRVISSFITSRLSAFTGGESSERIDTPGTCEGEMDQAGADLPDGEAEGAAAQAEAETLYGRGTAASAETRERLRSSGGRRRRPNDMAEKHARFTRET